MNGDVDIVDGPQQRTLGQDGPELVVPFPPQSPYPRVDPKDVLAQGQKSKQDSQKQGQQIAKGIGSLLGGSNQQSAPSPFPSQQVDSNFNLSSGYSQPSTPSTSLSLSSGGGSEQGFTVYGPGSGDPEDQPGGKTYDTDSFNGIGHIKGNPFDLNAEPSGTPAAMTYARGTEHYGIKPGDWYKSDYDGKMHRWMDTTGAANPDNEDIYYGPSDNADLPHFAEGGLVTQPTDAIVGEAGPEAIIKLNNPSQASQNAPRGTFSPMDEFDRMASEEDEVPPGEHPIGSFTPPVNINKQKSFLQEFREKHPEFNGIDEAALLGKAQSIYAPNMPSKEFEQMARSKLAKQLFKEGEDPSLTPIQRIMKAYPSFGRTGMSEEQALTAIYNYGVKHGKIDGNRIDFAAFKDQWQPPSQQNIISNFLKGTSGGMGAQIREVSGTLWGLPDASHRLMNQLIDSVGGQDAADAMEKWIGNNLIHPDLKKFANFINDYANNAAKANFYQSQKDAESAARAAGFPGTLGRGVGGAIGQIPAGLMTGMLFPGASLGARVALGAAYGEMSKYTRTQQTGGEFTYRDAFMSSAQGATFGLLMDTPMGRIASGNINMLLGADPDAIAEWLHNPDDKSKLGKIASTAASDFLLGVLLRGVPEEKPRSKDLGRYAAGDYHVPFEGGGPSSPVTGSPKFQLQQGPPRMPGPQGFVMGPDIPQVEPTQHWEEGGYHPDVQQEIHQAVEARTMGDMDNVKKHADQAVSMMPEKQQKQVQEGVIDQVHKMAQKADPVDIPVKDEPKEPYEWGTPNEMEESKPGDKFHDEPGAFFYSGLGWQQTIDFIEQNLAGLRNVVKALAHPLEKPTQQWRALFNPEEYSGGEPGEVTPSRLGGSILRDVNVRTPEMVKAKAADLAREMGLQNSIVFGDRPERREAHLRNFSDSENKNHIYLAEKGRVKEIKDKNVRDFMEFYLEAAKMLNKIEEDAGIGYKIRDNYIFHAIKKEDQERFYRDLKNRGIDPDFVHPRQFNDVMEMLAAGYDLKTWNPETLFQMRMHASINALRQIEFFHQMRDEGLAWVAGDPNVPKEGFRSATTYRTPDKLSWYLHPDLEPLYKNGFDHSKLYNSMVGGPAKFFQALRGTTSALTLAWSGFHMGHILRIRGGSSLTNAVERATRGHGTGEEFLRAAVDILTNGSTAAWRDRKGYGRVMEYERHEIDLKDLTPEEKEFINWKNEAGISLEPHPGHEIDFIENLSRGGIRYINTVLNRQGMNTVKAENLIQTAVQVDKAWTTGFHFMTGGWEGAKSGKQLGTKWLFNHMIPAMKAADLAERVDILFQAHPEYRKTEFSKERRLALTEIGKEIEGRYGEMFYDNLFWNKTIKDIGSSIFLSLGWQLSALRIHGGLVHDLTENATHLDKIIASFKAAGAKEGLPKLLTSKILFAIHYSALSMLTGAVLTAWRMLAWNSQHPDQKQDPTPSGSDFFFPRVGVNPDGSPKRVNTPDFTREIPSIWHHLQGGDVSGIIGNKLQPLLSSVYQTVKNSNYYGQQIYSTDPNVSIQDKTISAIGYILQNSFLPIPFKQATQQRTGQAAPFHGMADVANPGAWKRLGQRTMSMDTILSFMGYAPASQWTQRSGIENEIVERFSQEQGHQRTVESMPRYNALMDYRAAILDKDQEQIKEAYTRAKAAGVSDRTLMDSAKNVHIPLAKRVLKLLSPNSQAEILSKMQGQQRFEYEQVASKKGLAALYQRENRTGSAP